MILPDDNQLEARLRHVERQLIDLRNEIDGQYQMIAGRIAGWEGLARLVSEQGKRLTLLERKKP